MDKKDKNSERLDSHTKWYGWGSPIGLGLWLVFVGLFLWLMHLAGIMP